jgi:hypothetical protein
MISPLLLAVIPALLFPWMLIPLQNQALFAVLPLAPAAVAYARLVAQRRATHAVALALAWAVALSVSTIAAGTYFAGSLGAAIWRAGAYRDEMVLWIATGRGAEGSIAQFLPRVLVESARGLGLAALSAGMAGLFLGALLLGYMNGYVAWVVAHAEPSAGSLSVALLAWPPWSMCRVVSFVLAGTAGALWGYPRILARGEPRAPVGRLLLWSGTFLLLDIGLKWWLAPLWREFLRTLLGASAGIEPGGSG